MISTRNQNLKDAYKQLIRSQRPEFFIHLATNQYWEPGYVKGLVRKYLARIDSAFLGSKWSKRPAAERMDGVFGIEHLGSNIHVHGVVTAPYCNVLALQLQSEKVWDRLCPSGTVEVDPVTYVAGAADYALKEAYKDRFFEDQIFFAREFWRS